MIRMMRVKIVCASPRKRRRRRLSRRRRRREGRRAEPRALSGDRQRVCLALKRRRRMAVVVVAMPPRNVQILILWPDSLWKTSRNRHRRWHSMPLMGTNPLAVARDQGVPEVPRSHLGARRSPRRSLRRRNHPRRRIEKEEAMLHWKTLCPHSEVHTRVPLIGLHLDSDDQVPTTAKLIPTRTGEEPLPIQTPMMIAIVTASQQEVLTQQRQMITVPPTITVQQAHQATRVPQVVTEEVPRMVAPPRALEGVRQEGIPPQHPIRITTVLPQVGATMILQHRQVTRATMRMKAISLIWVISTLTL